MMKRILAGLMFVVLLVWIPVTASAAENETIDEADRPCSISVKAVYIGSDDQNVYYNNISGGTSSVITRNGIAVIVTGGEEAFELGTKLVVREITAEETEAYGWFSGVLKETGTDIMPFDIYFEMDGQKIPLNSKIKITVNLPDGYTTPVICYVTTDGRVEVIQSDVRDGKISFETDHMSYYVLADKIKDSPQTGDNTNILFYITMMAIFAGLFIFMTGRFKYHGLERINSI